MAGKRPALGRGLEALFGDIEVSVPVAKEKEPEPQSKRGKKAEAAAPEDAVLYIDINEIKPNSMQPRQAFNPETIEELAASIETYGVIQPIILAKAKNGYELVAGERRWRAARKAGLRTIPAIIRKVTEEENALIAVIENMQRENLNTLEEATAYRAIIDKYGMTQEALAKIVGKSRPHVANMLRALTMPPEILDMLRSGALTLGHANALGAIKDVEQQIGLARKIVKSDLSVRDAERFASQPDKKQAKKKEKPGKTNEIRIIEQELTSSTGIRVVINGDGEKGGVELHYYDRQGLEEIIDLLRASGKRGK